jgi:hypothetical protein
MEAARAERMRQNGNGALTLEDARTWMEETGLCLFLPKRQLSSSLAPSFVEAIAGQRNHTPDQKQIALAEELLVRLELDGVAVRLNLLGQPGEQPDYVVAAWVLPYVYALRGDRDWRRIPQLTGSRQVSPLAVQAYKRLEAAEANIAELKQLLGHGVSDTAVLRAITELWQQLRIIPVVSAPGKAAKWQLLRIRFQKAIAEGASTSQVTAISVLASIYLQAVIAASMEEVEIFLSPLTARSKIREVLRGLVATRQVHTLALGHAPHFYVAGTLPEFTTAPAAYASATFGSTYFSKHKEPEEIVPEFSSTLSAAEEKPADSTAEFGRSNAHRPAASRNGGARTHFSRPAPHSRDRKSAPAPGRNRNAGAANSRGSASRPSAGTGSRNGNGNHAGASTNGARKAGPAHTASRPGSAARPAKATGDGWRKRTPTHAAGKGKPSANGRSNGNGISRTAGSHRADVRGARGSRKPAATSARGTKRLAMTSKPGNKKRG